MNIFKGSLGIALVMLVVVAMLGSACGPGEAPSAPPPTTGGNQPPVISSLTAAQTQVYPNGNTEIQCVASDPDDDKIAFEWACTGGSFSITAPGIVTWKAPGGYGEYDVTVTVEDGKGGSVQRTLTLTVAANQPPQISSLVANPSNILYANSTLITCIANDPDGDVVRYSWSASEGSISGVGEKVTWVAPNKGGNFTVAVLVSDGKGGETTGNVMVTVSAVTKTVTIPVIAQETGTVDKGGDKDNSKTMAGDDADNTGYRAFWSFNIQNLWGTEIQNANLKFTTRNVANDPFSQTTGLKGLRLWEAKYGDRLPDFNHIGTKLDHASAVSTQPPTVIDVTPEINRLVQNAASRFQLEAQFLLPTNGNNKAEWIEWSEVVLEVTYSEK